MSLIRDMSGFILSPTGSVMNRAEVLQEVRLMKFHNLYSRRQSRQLTQEQAAEILGVSRADRPALGRALRHGGCRRSV